MSTRSIFSGWRLPTLVGLGILLVIVSFSLDDSAAQLLRLNSKDPVRSLASLFSKFGDWPYLLMFGSILSLLLFGFKKTERSRLLLVVLVAGMLAGFSATIVRSAVCRTRPSSQHLQGFYGPVHNSHWLVGKAEFGSFPSGHTATVMGLVAAGLMVNRRWTLAFALFAVAVAWSRIALNCHHFSDIIAATVWSFFMAPLIFRFVEPRIKLPQPALAPVPVAVPEKSPMADEVPVI